ncbi:hypothetical protein CEXT_802401 [Caerostris extrusa]|uniref:Uncharacterized protein n=1 Tax=Caerostris extrusa TaxID=172846 RepID=A0AAV4Y7Z4_CAEEX|nr:hypothetical protein CEXT_802401 [Caerostris extrusa]
MIFKFGTSAKHFTREIFSIFGVYWPLLSESFRVKYSLSIIGALFWHGCPSHTWHDVFGTFTQGTCVSGPSTVFRYFRMSCECLATASNNSEISNGSNNKL